jgi:hypothetical protein
MKKTTGFIIFTFLVQCIFAQKFDRIQLIWASGFKIVELKKPGFLSNIKRSLQCFSGKKQQIIKIVVI